MDSSDSNERLSKIVTCWTTFQKAHQAPSDPAMEAQTQILQRYSGAVYRYLLGALRDADAADELFQEFALRFVRGDFRRADPEFGRFRDFLKTTLYHLVVDVQRRRKRAPGPLQSDLPDPVIQQTHSLEEAEAQFREIWRGELLDRAWKALAEEEQSSGKPYFAVLRFRVDHPQLSSAEISVKLSNRLGKTVSAEWVRKWLLNARREFSQKLFAELRLSLDKPSDEELERELIDLGLINYCRPAVEQGLGHL